MKYADILTFPSIAVDTTAYWDSFLTTAQLDYLSALADDVSEVAGIGGNGIANVDLKVRTSKIGWLYRNEATEGVWESVSHAASMVNSTYFQYQLDGFFEPGQLTNYSGADGGHYDWHQDGNVRNAGVFRKLSCAILLSDPSEFTGGDLLLKPTSDTPVKVEQRRGRMWCFPSWMLHKVTPVTSGCRKSLILWVGGPPFR